MLHCTILVAIGANLPGPDGRSARDTCEWAIGRLAAVAGLELVGCSRWFRSAPVPPSGQPDYVNGVARLRGEAEPEGLLVSLHGIEAEAGRVRGERNAARTLDLDLLAIDALVQAGPALILPHPRLHERSFVLLPLLDVAPDWVHPLLHRSAAGLLEGVVSAGTEPLPCAKILASTSQPP